jgi:hypothetical protein
MKGKWLGSLGVVLSACLASTRADDVRWRSAAQTPPVVIATPGAGSCPLGVTLGQPVALGKPIPSRAAPPAAAFTDPQLKVAGYDTPRSGVGLGPVIRGQNFDPGPPPVPPPGEPAVPGGPVGPAIPPVPAPGPGLPPGPVDPLCGPGSVAPMAGPNPWMDRCRQWFGWCGDWNRALFMSDHCFDGFASPVSNPFWFEDPRALTEVRPIFIYQRAQKTSVLNNGNIEWFGAQLRLALTDNLSIVVHKLGGVAWQPGNAASLGAPGVPPPGSMPVDDATGFSEVTIGPKFTFLRLRDSQTLGAVGVAFDIPTGPNSVKQDTQSLTIRPYVTFGQAFGQTSFGTFNSMAVVGYNFGVNDRSDNLFAGLHLDYNVGNFNRLYPLIELNYTYYTGNGNGTYKGVPIVNRVEGRDLFNFGSTTIKNHNDLTLAAGLRYKFAEWAQVGSAAEFPLTGAANILGFRWTFDLIFRY